MMKFKIFVFTAAFAAILASCGSGSKEPQNTTADPDDAAVSQICEKYKVECGDFLATVDGFLKAIFCGDCESGSVCDDATNRCIDGSYSDDPQDDQDSPENDSDDIHDDSEGPQDDNDDLQESGLRTISCTNLPENAEWNIVSEITQTFDGTNWLPSEKAVFNSESSTERCRFICKEEYVWNSQECVPYTLSGLPKCRSNIATTCEDTSTGMIWSTIVLNRMDWGNAKAYCEDFEEGGYNDWHLPNVDEIRTMIRNCSKMITGGECPVSESNGIDSSIVNNWLVSCSCSDTEAESVLGTRNKTLWTSSSVPVSTMYAWTLDSNFSLSMEDKETIAFFHCVRSNYFLRDDHCGKHYTWNGSDCIADTKRSECKGLPENAEWNAVSTITQTWNGTNWIPSEIGIHNTSSSSSECRFKCYEEFAWDGNECVLSE
ncbi:DUF1566 domain-containing protein [bacterium]|nr:DUF1566 domain-containing protein [bacterium]